MTQDAQDCLREVSKWINERPNGSAPIEAMAKVCTALWIEMEKPGLLTGEARRKLSELEADGYTVCGLVLKRGEMHALITDLGNVQCWAESSDSSVNGDMRTEDR